MYYTGEKKSIGKNKFFKEIQKKQKCNRNNGAYTKEKMEKMYSNVDIRKYYRNDNKILKILLYF